MRSNFRFFSFVFSFLTCFNSIGYAAELAEEGCRYHGTLQTHIIYCKKQIEHDFWAEHEAMAKVIQVESDDGQYTSMLRFTPVIIVGGELKLGNTVFLRPIESLQSSQPSFELGFASGIFNSSSQDVSMKYGTSTDLIVRSSSKKEEERTKTGIMTLRPALHKRQKESISNTYPIRFLMANFVDPGILKLQLTQRYVKIEGSIINTRNKDAICTPHERTIEAIELRNKRSREIFTQIAEEISEDATSIVLTRYQEELDKLKTPNSNPQTNSYNCAEQCQFTYLRDTRVQRYLQKYLEVNADSFIGVIVNAHCSHTPCHTCATSFTREAELGGVFHQIANGRTVHILCSCQAHYERPNKGEAKMLQYQETGFFEHLKQKELLKGRPTLSFNSGADKSPYPVVLMKSNPETGNFSVDFEHYTKLAK